jgi:hypothetical protein
MRTCNYLVTDAAACSTLSCRPAGFTTRLSASVVVTMFRSFTLTYTGVVTTSKK